MFRDYQPTHLLTRGRKFIFEKFRNESRLLSVSKFLVFITIRNISILDP